MFCRNRWLHLFLTFGFLFGPLSYAQEIRPLTLEADGSKIRWVDANKTGIVVPQGSSDTLICDPALLSIAAANGLGSGTNCISLRNFSTSPTNYVATTSATFANFLSSFQSDASKTACDVVPDPWSEWDGTPPVASSNWLDPSLCGVQEYTETRICTEPQYSCSDTCPGPDSTFSEDRTASVDNGDANVWHPVGDNESSVGASCYVPDTAIYNEVNECGQQRARTISCTLMPAIPAISVPASDLDGSYTVSWAAVDGAATYRLIGEGSGIIYAGSATSVVRSMPTGVYSYAVSACTEGNVCTEYSGTRTVTVDITPSAPLINVPSTDTDGLFTISWSSVSGASRYQLSSGGVVIYDGAGTSTSVNRTNGIYSFKVRSVNALDTASGWSVTKSITVDIPPPIPATPVLTVPTDDSNSYFRVSWTSVANATSYELVQSGEGVGWHFVYQGSATSKLFTTVGTGDYQYKVRAKNSSGSSAYSSPQSINVNIKPAVPSLTVPSTDTDGTFTISWSNVSGATRYQLFSGGVGVYDGAGTSTTVTRTNGTYSFQVRALNSKNNPSNWSATRSITVDIPPPIPATPVLTVPSTSSTGNYTVEWSRPANATRYVLQGESAGVLYSGGLHWLARSKVSGTYGYKVKACADETSDYCSPYTSIKSITVDIPPPIPATPVLTVPTDDSNSYFRVSWTSVANATSYELVQTGEGVGWHFVYQGSATSKLFTTVGTGDYQYKVRAKNSSGSSAYSSPQSINVNIKPAVPSLTVPSTDTDGTFTISWSNVSGATRYQLFSGGVGVYDGAGTSTTVTRTNGTYSFQVRALNSKNNPSNWSATKSITVNIPPTTPPTPVLSVPSSSSSGTYTVSWSAVSPVTRYELVGESLGTIYSGTSRSAIRTKPNGTYGYKIRACNGSGSANCSAYSAIKSITVDIPIPTPAPPVVSVPATSSGSHTVSWTSPAHAVRFIVRESGTQIYDGPSLSKFMSGRPNGSYTYSARSCNADNSCSSWSAGATTVVTVAPTIPSTPVLTVPTDDSNSYFRVSWTSVANATSYELVQTGEGVGWHFVYQGSATSKLFTTVGTGDYQYKVRAKNSSGSSAYSSPQSINVNIKPAVPSLTVPSTDTDGTFTISWSNVSGATRYQLFSGGVGVYDGAGTSTTVTRTNGTYSFQVRALNSKNNPSNWSATKTITVNIPPTIPPTPALTLPTLDADGIYYVSWSAVSPVTRYELVGESSGTIYSGTGRSLRRVKPNGTYGYKVRACNGSGSANCSAYSAIKAITVNIPPTIPPTPALTLPTLDADGIYYVSWSAVSPVTRYELVGESSGTIYSGTGRSLRRVKPNGTYGYKIRACNGSGSANCSAYSAIKSITVDIPIPTPAPPVVSVPATSSGSHTVSWTSPAHAVRFIVRESGTQIYDGPSLSKFMSGRPNGSYTYSARSCNADNSCSSWSAGATTVVTVAPTIPSTPILTVPSTSTTGNYTVQWSRPANATRYVLQGESAGVLYSGGLHWLARSKDPGVYGYKVKACADNTSTYCSGYSGIKSITVLCTSDVWTPDNGLTKPQTQATCYEPNTITYYETNECGISRSEELPCTGCNPNAWSCAATGGSLASCAATCPTGSTFATVNACGQTGTAACTGPPLTPPGQCGPYNNRAFVSYNNYFVGTGPGNSGTPGKDINSNHCSVGNKVFTRNGPSSCGRNFCQYKTYWVCSGSPDSAECGVNIRSGGRYGP